jgi:prenyltransferase beta subunit
MQQAAGAARTQLRDAAGRVADFLQSQFHPEGGACNRSGDSDLYYTVFAAEGLVALGTDPPFTAIRRYLTCFEDGEGLDLVHVACLIRCWAAMPGAEIDADLAKRMLRRIESHRSEDGGYHGEPDRKTGTVYHAFLALAAYQDLRAALPNPEGLVRSIAALQTGDGAFANEHGLKLGTTPATAAAATLLRHLGVSVPNGLTDWLLESRHEQGGFLAMPAAPFPDLLSTATALHALAGMGIPLDGIRDGCLDFLDALWTGRAFHGHLADDVEDCEYTYYALLALGHLSS